MPPKVIPRIESGRNDDGHESDQAGIEMADLGATGAPIDFSDANAPAVASDYEHISSVLGAVADGYDVLSPADVALMNAAMGYGAGPPPADPATNAPPAPAPVQAGVVQPANAQAGHLGGAAPAALAQPPANAQVQQAAAVAAAGNPGQQPVVERTFLQEHWKMVATVLTLSVLGLGGGLGLYLARNSIWPPDTDDKTVPKPTPMAAQINVKADFINAGQVVDRVLISLTDTSLQTANLHGFDVSTFAFVMPDTGEASRRTSVHGIYKLDTVAKTLTFFPATIFPGGEASVDFTVDDPASSGTKLQGRVVLTYPVKPVVYDQLVDHGYDVSQPVSVNVLSGTLVTAGLKGRGQAAKPGTEAINPASVTFTGFEILDPLDNSTIPGYSRMNQTMVVPNQGTWDVDAKGVITFTPVAGFTSPPYPATFQVGDNSKRPSNVARVIINADVVKTLQAIEAFAKGADTAFWQAYEAAIIRATTPPAVPLWNEINALALTYTRIHIDAANRAAAQSYNATAYPAAKTGTIYADWMMGAFDATGTQTRAPYDRAYLWDTYITPITDAVTNLPPGGQGTRLVRLSLLDRLLARYIADLN